MKPTYRLLAFAAMYISAANGQIVNDSFETNSIDSNDASITSELANTPGGVDNTSPTATGWTFLNSAGIIETFSVTSTAANEYRFGIGSTVAGSGYLFVDNVPVTPVPEPTKAALLGLGGLALIFRRRS